MQGNAMKYLFSLPVLLFCVTFKSFAIEIYAHRGGAGLLPENTLEAIQASLEIGVDVIDVDIGLTKDNVVVAYHDVKLNPSYTRNSALDWLSKPGPALTQLSFAALQQYDVGQINPNSLYKQQFPYQQPKAKAQIPSLQQAIKLIKLSNKPVRIQIEIKTDPDPNAQSPSPTDIVPKLIKVLRDENFIDKAEVHSFDWRNLILLQMLAPEITTSYISDNELLAEHNYKDWLANNDIKVLKDSFPVLINKLGGTVWCPNFQDLTKELVEEAHQLGLKINVWTVDEPKDMLSMIELGVDGIITNRPDILRGLLAASGKIANPKNVCSIS